MQEWAYPPTQNRYRAELDRDRSELWTFALGKIFVGPFQLEWLLDQFEWSAREGDQT